jgi:hypothetical protein
MKPFQPPPAVDLLDQFITGVRPRLIAQATPKGQLELLWSLAKSARDLAAHDIWEAEFKALADELGLIANRRVQDDGIDHVLRWAWRDMDPFE